MHVRGQVGSQRSLPGSWSDAPGGTGGEETSFLGHHDWYCASTQTSSLAWVGWRRVALEPKYLNLS